MGKMNEKDLNAILDAHIAGSIGNSGKLAEERRNALAYYYGEAKGDLAPPDIDGRSSIVSTDVADTIEWIMPTLMRIFTGGDSAVEFAPQRQEDEAFAKQATEYVNYLFYRRNHGFLILHTWFKDALLQKYGVVQTWWDKHKEDVREEYKGLTSDELAYLLQSTPGLEVTEQKPCEDYPELVDVVCKRSKDMEQVRVSPIPPENFIVDRKARSLDEASAVGHWVERSMSDLRAAGFPKAKLDRLGEDQDAGWTVEAQERAQDDDFGIVDDDVLNADESQRKIKLYELYVRCDWDGDGIAEWRQVKRAGREILSNEKVDGHTYSGLTPILMSHRLIGRSIADLVMDLQRIKTALMRQTLDNMYLVNNGRHYVDMTKKVNLDDLLNSRPGGIVRGEGPDGVSSLAPPLLGGGGFQLIEYIDTVKENRTGVTRYNQGMDANSLNKTASGVTQIMGAAQQRIELVARVLAETGVVDMFKKILKLVTTHQNKAQIVRLTGGYVEVDPSQWRTQFDVTVNVGLGTGNKDQQAAHLTNILQMQQALVPAGIVTPQNLYETAKRLPEAMGFKSDAFFTDPAQAQHEASNQPPAPDPEQMKLEAQQQAKLAEMDFQWRKFQEEMAFKREQMDRDYQLRAAELELKYMQPSLPVVAPPQELSEPVPAMPMEISPEMPPGMPPQMVLPVSDDFFPPQIQGSEGLIDE